MRPATTLDRSGDIRDELSAKGGVPEHIEKIWFRKVVSTVIDSDRCVQCGACVAACPSGSISIAEDDKPTLTRMCTGCSCCWDICPRGGLRYERLWTLVGGEVTIRGIEPTRAAYTARAISPNPGVQDGGVGTAILEELFKAGEIDGAVVTVRSGSPFRGEAYIARSIKEIRASAGSVYSQTLPLARLVDISGFGLPPKAKLAFIGTPCQISGVRFLQRFRWKYGRGGAEAVKYTIALMCTRSFHPGRLTQKLKELGVDLGSVNKIDVKSNIIRLFGKGGETVFEGDAKQFRDAALRGCAECADFSGKLADITLGSVGSPRGFSSVLIRTPQGERAWSIARGALEHRGLEDMQAIVRIEERNLKKALRGLERRFDPEAPLWIGYGEHLQNYAGTSKGPVKPMSYRCHHYDRTC